MTAAERAWELLQDVADANSRHGELAEALGFRLGAGRGKVLFRLVDGPLTLGEVAEVIGSDAPYATLVVDKLESHGLVERRPHPDDRRRKLVTLTAKGGRAVETAEAIRRRPPDAVRALSKDDLARLTALLSRLTLG